MGSAIALDVQCRAVVLDARGADAVGECLVVRGRSAALTGPRPVLVCSPLEGLAGFFDPRPLALDLAGVARARSTMGRAPPPFHGASVGDLPGDERPLSAAGVDGGDREPLPGGSCRRMRSPSGGRLPLRQPPEAPGR